jgi:hypothetical protein
MENGVRRKGAPGPGRDLQGGGQGSRLEAGDGNESGRNVTAGAGQVHSRSGVPLDPVCGDLSGHQWAPVAAHSRPSADLARCDWGLPPARLTLSCWLDKTRWVGGWAADWLRRLPGPAGRGPGRGAAQCGTAAQAWRRKRQEARNGKPVAHGALQGRLLLVRWCRAPHHP